MSDEELMRSRLKAYFRMISVHDPYLGNELVDVLDAYLDAKFKREWQGLTDEERAEAWAKTKGDLLLRLPPFSLAIEAKLKEKNNG